MGTKKVTVKDPIAVALSAKRMTRMTAKRRREVAAMGGTARWAKRKATAEHGAATE